MEGGGALHCCDGLFPSSSFLLLSISVVIVAAIGVCHLRAVAIAKQQHHATQTVRCLGSTHNAHPFASSVSVSRTDYCPESVQANREAYYAFPINR